MTDAQSVNWQLISELPTVARSVDELLENVEEQYESLSEARGKPHVLDDEIIDRVDRLYIERLQYLRIYRQQLEHWKRVLMRFMLKCTLGDLTRENSVKRFLCMIRIIN